MYWIYCMGFQDLLPPTFIMGHTITLSPISPFWVFQELHSVTILKKWCCDWHCYTKPLTNPLLLCVLASLIPFLLFLLPFKGFLHCILERLQQSQSRSHTKLGRDLLISTSSFLHLCCSPLSHIVCLHAYMYVHFSVALNKRVLPAYIYTVFSSLRLNQAIDWNSVQRIS